MAVRRLKSHHSHERLISFTSSWFTVCMGTGIVISLTANFPWPAHWLMVISYIFWILSIVLFTIFFGITIVRYVKFPSLIKATLNDLQDACYTGCIPIALDTITNGILIHYPHGAGIWVAYALWWIAVVMSVFVGMFVFFYITARQPQHELSSITGVTLLAFIPLLVTSATGGLLNNYLPQRNTVLVLVISFMMWAVGISISTLYLGIYLWRLLADSLPPRNAIVSCFIQVGPLGMGAYSIQLLARSLAAFLIKSNFTPKAVSPVGMAKTPGMETMATAQAVAATIHWMGIIFALFLMGHATFWLFEALSSVIYRIPKTFNIGFWGFTFPLGVYALGVNFLSNDLNNTGLRVWGAICTVTLILLWLFCAVNTLVKGVWQGQLLHAPGLEQWVFDHDKHGDEEGQNNHEKQKKERSTAHDLFPAQRQSTAAGTYKLEQRADPEA